MPEVKRIDRSNDEDRLQNAVQQIDNLIKSTIAELQNVKAMQTSFAINIGYLANRIDRLYALTDVLHNLTSFMVKYVISNGLTKEVFVKYYKESTGEDPDEELIDLLFKEYTSTGDNNEHSKQNGEN